MATNAKMKSFYRQRKKRQSGGMAKPKGRSSKKSPPTNQASEDYDEKEKVLRQFDMNMAFGPCVGMTRMARWERANRLGLNPPQEIGVLLKNGKVLSECLWEDRI